MTDDVRALRHQLRTAGYCPIPLYGKEPPTVKNNNKRKPMNGWQTLQDVTPEQIDMWTKTWPDSINTGCLTFNMPVIDIDILNEEAARALEDHVRERFEERGYILVRIGKPPKRAIPFRAAMGPFKTFKVSLIAPDGSEGQKIELLADGAQLVVDGVHPDTKQPYSWFGGELGKIPREELADIREDEAHTLVEDIVELLIRDFGYKRAPSRPKANGGAAPKAHDGGGGGDRGWAYLMNNIREGRELHDSIRDLAAMMIASGMNSGAAINQLRALMESSAAPKDDRHRARVLEIPDAVDGAVAKYGKAHTPTPQAARSSSSAAGGPDPRLASSLELDAEDEDEDEDEPAAVITVVLDATEAADTVAIATVGIKLKPHKLLIEVHSTFQKWLGADYDIDAIDLTCCAAVCDRLTGDPLWPLIISGPGAAKTETAQSLAGAGAQVTSTISSEGALLSATSRKSRAKGATGGLLKKLGDHGVLVIKDFTSIISADRNTRGAVLSGIREIFDGKFERNVGTDGGQTLTWNGRIIIVAACTTAWDSAYSVVAIMGDRFVIIRIDSTRGRRGSGLRAIKNTGDEIQMRKEMASAVGTLIAHASVKETHLDEDETKQLLDAADIVTLARTAVEFDHKGDVSMSHAPEMPTRFAKQLAQIIRGGVAIGLPRKAGMRLAIRCARDSIPPLRLAILLDIAANPDCRPGAVRKRISKPWRTVKREMDALVMLGILIVNEETDTEHTTAKNGTDVVKTKTYEVYDLNPEFDRKTLMAMAAINPAKTGAPDED